MSDENPRNSGTEGRPDGQTTLGETVKDHIAEIAIVGGLLTMLLLSLSLGPDSRAISPSSGGWDHAQTYLLFLLSFTQILTLARLHAMSGGMLDD